MTIYDAFKTIQRFSKEMPDIRMVYLQDDGELIGFWSMSMADVGWNVPVVGDRHLKTHDVGDHEWYTISHRYYVDEGFGPTYWLIVLKPEDETPFGAALANHMMLVTDLEEAQAAGDPEGDVNARMQQLWGQPSGRVRIKPKSRDPEPDREWEEDEDEESP